MTQMALTAPPGCNLPECELRMTPLCGNACMCLLWGYGYQFASHAESRASH